MNFFKKPKVPPSPVLQWKQDEALVEHNGHMAKVRCTIAGSLQMKYVDSDEWFYPDQVWDEFKPEALRIIADLKEDYFNAHGG